jgi:hypothetical protein
MSCGSRRMRRRRRRRRRKRKEGRRQSTQNFTGAESGQAAGLVVSDVEIWVLLPEICLINKVNFRDMAMSISGTLVRCSAGNGHYILENSTSICHAFCAVHMMSSGRADCSNLFVFDTWLQQSTLLRHRNCVNEHVTMLDILETRIYISGQRGVQSVVVSAVKYGRSH